MATLRHLFDLQEQICYVQCSFCTTILLVSVPLSSMSTVVTVKCGHCTSLLSVDMLNALSLPFNLLAALHQNPQQEMEQLPPQEAQGGAHKPMDMWSTNVASSEHDQEADEVEEEEEGEDDKEHHLTLDHDDICISKDHVVHKPPEKKKRVPSAYNRFIKEEIRRLKAGNPFMTHKEAFSTASKNWAHFPNSLQQQEDEDDDEDDDDDDKNPLKGADAENPAEEMRDCTVT